MKHILSFLFSLIVILGCKEEHSNTENVLHFVLSECDEKCDFKTKGGIIESTLSNATLTLKMGHWMNCSMTKGDLRSAILIGDTLDLSIMQKGAIEGEKIRVTDCNCFYRIELALKNAKMLPIVIRINDVNLENTSGY